MNILLFLRAIKPTYAAIGVLLLALVIGYAYMARNVATQKAQAAQAKVAVAECQVVVSEIQAQVGIANTVVEAAASQAKQAEKEASRRAKAVLNEKTLPVPVGAEGMNEWLSSL